MGNASSSEEVKNSYRRRLSKHQAMASWVQIAGENDYYGAPTTTLSGTYQGLNDAIPTVPSFALLQHQSLSGIQRPKTTPALGNHLSAASGPYKSRPSRHSTDAFHPLRSAPVSGSARAASINEDDALGNDAENNKLDELYFSSPPNLSSSSSTESWRTLSSDSDTSREPPPYIRRRSLQRIPGLATRLEKQEIHRQDLPASPPRNPYSPLGKTEGIPVPSFITPVQNEDPNDLGKSSEVGYKQLGSIKFGSLRITNGSPLSMRRDEPNTDEPADLVGDMEDNGTSSGVATNLHHISPPSFPLIEMPNGSTFIEHFPPINSNSSAEQPLTNMHLSETVRGRQGRNSSETQRPSFETLPNRVSSILEVIGDEHISMVKRSRSTLVTADDSSSVYSDNVIPVMISDDIAAEHMQAHNDNSNGPQLSFQSFRKLIRQNRVKSYLQSNNKAEITNKVSHQRSASEEDSFLSASTRSPSRLRRKLSKKSPGTIPPPEPPSSYMEANEPEATKLWPLPSQAPNHDSAGERKKSHSRSKSDVQAPHTITAYYDKVPVPRIPQQTEQTLRAHFDAYQTASDHDTTLNRTRQTPRARVNFEGDRPRKKRGAARVEELRRSQTTEFKPLPTPRPELPQRRKPVRVSAPVPSRLGTQDYHESLKESQTKPSPYPLMPSHARSHTMPLVTQQYTPSDDDDEDDDVELQLFFPDSDSPYVSPLSDDDEHFWPLTTNVPLSQSGRKPPPSFQPREVSPIRHAKSMSSFHKQSEGRQIRTPAPISAHSRRAQELAERWQQQQQQQQQQHSRTLSREQPQLPAFYEHVASRPTTASAIEEYYSSPLLFMERDSSLPPMVYRNGTRRGSEISSTVWRPPYRVLHSYYSPAYRNAPIWG